MRNILLFSLGIVTITTHAQTVGWFYSNPGTADGYVLFAPSHSDTTYLIDKCGKRIHEWGSQYDPGLAVYLLDDGTLLRCGNTENNLFNGGGQGGIVEKLDWDGNVLWSYKISDNLQCQHHDAIQLPNGNIMAIVWEDHTKADAQANGRISLGSHMWSEKIIEIQPLGADSGTIVWQWRAWDHLVQDADSTKLNYGVVADHPELLDINLGTLNTFAVDWLHFNSLDYNADLDQLMISCHELSEVYILDHSTTTDEAASHTGGNSGRGGDLLYRWGNPKNYGRGTSDDQKLFEQHNAHQIPQGYPGEGTIMVFNNGVGRPGTDYSTVETFTLPDMIGNNYPIEPDSAYEPDEQDWIYTATPPNSFFSVVMGGAQRLPNGNTLVCNATSGKFFEIDSDSDDMWQYINPVDINGNTPQGDQPVMNSCFRVTHLPFDHPGLAGKSLIPGSPIELDPFNYICENIPTAVAEMEIQGENIIAYPNPFQNSFAIHISNEVHHATLEIHDVTGRLLYEKNNFAAPAHSDHSITLNDYKGIIIVSLKDEDGNQVWNTKVAAQ